VLDDDPSMQVLKSLNDLMVGKASFFYALRGFLDPLVHILMSLALVFFLFFRLKFTSFTSVFVRQLTQYFSKKSILKCQKIKIHAHSNFFINLLFVHKSLIKYRFNVFIGYLMRIWGKKKIPPF